jgi:hypothetical protein
LLLKQYNFSFAGEADVARINTSMFIKESIFRNGGDINFIASYDQFIPQ